MPHITTCSRMSPRSFHKSWSQVVFRSIGAVKASLVIPWVFLRTYIDKPLHFNYSHTGGHGALTIYLSSVLSLGPNQAPKQYRSVSAFAPIANPTNCPWGKNAFEGYLQGGIQEAKERYDATELITRCRERVHILIDYGTGDKFYQQGQLLPENFLKAARDVGYDEVQIRVRSQEAYDHSYYFVRLLLFVA
jgi:Putative esterase